MIAFPGADSYRVTGMPSRSRTEARKSAALRVSPGGLPVSIATYWLRSPTSSSWLPGWLVAVTEHTKARTKDTKTATNALICADDLHDVSVGLYVVCSFLCVVVTFVAFVSVLFLCVLVTMLPRRRPSPGSSSPDPTGSTAHSSR